MLGRLHIKFEEIPSEIQLGKKKIFCQFTFKKNSVTLPTHTLIWLEFEALIKGPNPNIYINFNMNPTNHYRMELLSCLQGKLLTETS